MIGVLWNKQLDAVRVVPNYRWPDDNGPSDQLIEEFHDFQAATAEKFAADLRRGIRYEKDPASAQPDADRAF